MRAAAQGLATAGLGSVYLWVLRENRLARAFYGHLGGVVVAERIEKVAGEPHPELAYRWTDVCTLTA